MKMENRMAEDSFEKARKAFFGTATTTPNTTRRQSENSLARGDAQAPIVIEWVPFEKSVLELARDNLQAYATSAEEAINGRTPLVISQNSPEETAAIDVALYALAVLKRAQSEIHALLGTRPDRFTATALAQGRTPSPHLLPDARSCHNHAQFPNITGVNLAATKVTSPSSPSVPCLTPVQHHPYRENLYQMVLHRPIETTRRNIKGRSDWSRF
jgi:hypothetical protein